MKHAKLFCLAAALLSLSACDKMGQSQYNYTEVGKSQLVEFGSIVAVREVDIKGQNTGAGAYAGAAAGGVGGYQFGNGNGQLAATVAGAVVGAVAGAVVEQSLADDKGMEYVITKESGKTITVVQNIKKEDKIFAVGERVMVQSSGSYQRVLPAEHLPTEIKRPKGIKVVD